MTYLQRTFRKHTHKYLVDTDTGEAVCLCGKVQGSPKAPANKYHAKTSVYNGYTYDSKLEANVAMWLDWRKTAGEIKNWERQYRIEIRNPKTGELLRRHKVDFRVHHHDGSYELLEAKGYETYDYKKLKKEIEVLYLPEHLDHSYTVIKAAPMKMSA